MLTVLAGFGAGCASTGVSTTPVDLAPPASSEAPSTASSPSSAAAGASTQVAGVGDAIDLQGDDTSSQIEVTLVKIVDPDSSNDGFSKPPAGDRYVSFQFKILNRGSSTYQDDPLVEISATDSSGQSMQQDFLTSTSAGLQLPSSVNLTSGGTSLGYVTFDVPKGDFVAQVQYQMSFLGNVGQWQIKSS